MVSLGLVEGHGGADCTAVQRAYGVGTPGRGTSEARVPALMKARRFGRLRPPCVAASFLVGSEGTSSPHRVTCTDGQEFRIPITTFGRSAVDCGPGIRATRTAGNGRCSFAAPAIHDASSGRRPFARTPGRLRIASRRASAELELSPAAASPAVSSQRRCSSASTCLVYRSGSRSATTPHSSTPPGHAAATSLHCPQHNPVGRQLSGTHPPRPPEPAAPPVSVSTLRAAL
jgi:hypothetical protein